MTDSDRARDLYKLNGQLEGILRRLGSCVGQIKSLTPEKDGHGRQLSTLYDNLKRIQNAIFAQYLG